MFQPTVLASLGPRLNTALGAANKMNQGISKHFRREAIIMIGLIVAPVVLGILLALLWPHL